MSKNISYFRTIDWVTIFIYLFLIVVGWFNIYGASYDFDQSNMFDFSQRAGKQFVWILSAFVMIGIILLLDARMYSFFSYFIYIVVIFLLVATIFLAKDVKGSRSWLELGPITFQPAELAKIATALMLAKYMSGYEHSITHWRKMFVPSMIILLPFSLIVLQKETGSALVFLSFLLMLYREGMSGVVLLLGLLSIVLFVFSIGFSEIAITDTLDNGTLGMLLAMLLVLLIQVLYALWGKEKHPKALRWLLLGVLLVAASSYLLERWLVINYAYLSLLVVVLSSFYWLVVGHLSRTKKYLYIFWISLSSVLFTFSADYLFYHVLQPHQQSRIKVLLNMEEDLRGAGYNVNQSKIAIGSGGLLGKGYLNGTQTKLKYVPEQDTDFIFCTVGEEWGFVGTTILLLVYLFLLLRILAIAERQPDGFARIYGYGVAGIFFFHLMINVGMVIGIMPVIGIPLPFLSYGGSSLWSFTIMLFILLRLDATRFRNRGRMHR